MGVLLVVALAVQIDIAAGNAGEGYFKNTVLLLFIANEGLSILENCGGLGVPLPRPLLEALQKLGKGKE